MWLSSFGTLEQVHTVKASMAAAADVVTFLNKHADDERMIWPNLTHLGISQFFDKGPWIRHPKD
jgi:hypothetical protein